MTLLPIIFILLVPVVISDSEPQREVVLFDRADRNHDGTLTRQELDAVYLLFDVNHDKNITKDEFSTDWVTTFSLGNQKEADALFLSADVNDDGVINADDLPDIFSFFDQNSNGEVSINEFLTGWGQVKLQGQGQPENINIHLDSTVSTSPPTRPAP